MADQLTLSDEALSLLRLHLAGRPLVRRVIGKNEV